MAIRRVRTDSGFYRDERDPASIFMRVVMFFAVLLGGAVAGVAIMFFIQARFLLVPLGLWIGQGFVFGFAAIMGAISAYRLYDECLKEVIKWRRDEAQRRRKMIAERAAAGPPASYKHPMFM
ncbi:hypothetical protein CVU37_01505 [candidate division BRC1 bacterium HGW-BRC1-1]|jgi:ABC-type transport system involved in multi-copper enzyme maturation permease subunit|nr:MAG: hypothetical protein CVU37_01505 [candidate division BRC1 bacterium HGW-BRC1-1]